MTGLTNGTDYTFRVRAINELGEGEAGQSDWSDASAPEYPSTVPGTPAAPSVVAGDMTFTVTWPEADAGGDQVKPTYELSWTGEGGSGSVPKGTELNHTIDVENGKKYQFRVKATNRAGTTEGPLSAPLNAFGKPLNPPGGFQASEGDGVSVLTFNAPAPGDENGSPITRREYRRTSGSFPSDPDAGWTAVTSGTSVTVANGSTWQFQLRQCNAAGCSSVASTSARPFGAPQAPPGLTGSVNGNTITWSWSASATNGHGSVNYQVRVNGGSWGGPNNGARSHSVSLSCGQSRTIDVRAVGDRPGPSGRTISATASRSNNTPACPTTTTAPRPKVTLSAGGAEGACNGCHRFHVVWENMPDRAHNYICGTSSDGYYYTRDDARGHGFKLLTGPSGSADLYCYADASVFGGVQVNFDGVIATANW